MYFFCHVFLLPGSQGPTLTFEGSCPFGQSNPKFCLPEKISICPQNMLFCTLLLHIVTFYFVCLLNVFFMRINIIEHRIWNDNPTVKGIVLPKERSNRFALGKWEY